MRWSESKAAFQFLDNTGHLFCKDCISDFYGRYDEKNPALKTVMETVAAGRTPRWDAARSWDESQALFRLEIAYAGTVRRLSKKALQTKPAVINRKKRYIGSSGEHGAYQLDHIVPVQMCWDYYVRPEDAAAPANLQVIPWFVNMHRHRSFCIDRMVGWPHRRPPKRFVPGRRTRPALSYFDVESPEYQFWGFKTDAKPAT